MSHSPISAELLPEVPLNECQCDQCVGTGGPDKVAIRVRDYDGEGKLKLTQFNGDTFRVTSRLLNNGCKYIILEIIAENTVVGDTQNILNTCPNHESIKQMILDGNPKRFISS